PHTVHVPTDNFALRMIGVSAFALDDIARYCQFVLAFYIIATPAMTAAATFTEGRERVPLSPLLTGDYIWKPEISPAGPVVIIVAFLSKSFMFTGTAFGLAVQR